MRPLRLAVLAPILLALGCSSEPASVQPGKPPTPRIGVVLPMFSHPFFVSMKGAIEAEARRLGIEVDVRDGQDDDQKQIEQVQALLNMKVDALLLCPRDENAAVAAVEAANRANVPVVTVNRKVSGGQVVAYVGADDTDGGREQGEELVKALGKDGGKIIYLQGTPGSSPQVNRNKGLRDVLDKHPEIAIASDQYTDFQEDKAKSVMAGLVRRYKPGEVRAIVAQADELALPAAEVARAEGWKGLTVIGFNGTRGAFDAIQGGTMHATILQDPTEQGRMGLQAALNTVRGKAALSEIITPLPVITKDNVGKHRPSY